MAEEELNYDNELESGKYLFKYCKFDVNALQIIINKELYFSSPAKLNDPLDSNFELEIENPENFSDKTRDYIKHSGFPINEKLKSMLRDYSLLLGHVPKQDELLTEYFHDIQNNYLGICSFSTKAIDKNLMWSHYANEAKGLCLVFDREQLTQSLLTNKFKNYRMYRGKVTYDGVKPLQVEINKEGELYSTFDHLFSKTKHWAGEEEYRIILEKFNTDSFYPNIFIPFLNFDDNCLKFIIVGQRIDKGHYEMIHQLKFKGVFDAEILNHTFDK